MTTQEANPLLHTVPGAAEVLSLSRATINRLISRGELRAIKIGAATRITRDELEAFVLRQVDRAEAQQ